ncbi:MAG TPA: hypothetical protein VFA18_23735, partial [Gemmataceae bacterium]|nr:hypothetical protein [Gemmataceae bacterium]
MHFLDRVRDALADARLDANLLAFYGLGVAVIIVALILRRLLATGGNRIAAWAGEHWLGAVGEEASRRARRWLFWLTLLAVLAITVGGTVFHLKDGEVRVL